MRKLLYAVPSAALITVTLLTPVPAFAAPTCEQEISIRCRGYNVQGRPRLDIYYDSYEECYESEVTACDTGPHAVSSMRGLDKVILRKAVRA